MSYFTAGGYLCIIVVSVVVIKSVIVVIVINIIVIVIAAVFGADHQRVPITSNGPAAIRPLLSHLLLEKQDLNRFCRQSGSFHFQSSLLLNC